jgi:hypothetical protein
LGNSVRTTETPYTAEYKITRVQTLANGNTITRESTEVKAVDSQGRLMTATTTAPLSGDQTPITHVNVFDPEARTHTNWSSPGQKATVITTFSPGFGNSNCATTTTTSDSGITHSPARVRRVKPAVEDLGTETIQGVEAHGRKTTTTTSAGEIGNDEPLVRSIERWTAIASGLTGLVVREITDDPQSGKTTRELVSLNQGEPALSTFLPPEGYEIVNKDASESSCQSIQQVALPPSQ